MLCVHALSAERNQFIHSTISWNGNKAKACLYGCHWNRFRSSERSMDRWFGDSWLLDVKRTIQNTRTRSISWKRFLANIGIELLEEQQNEWKWLTRKKAEEKKCVVKLHVKWHRQTIHNLPDCEQTKKLGTTRCRQGEQRACEGESETNELESDYIVCDVRLHILLI